MLVRMLARLGLFRPVERLLVRYTGYSLLSWQLSRRSGVPYIPTPMLTTAGRNSAARYATPLFYLMDGADSVLLASKGGAPAHPDWFVNIRASPRVRVRVNRREVLVRAEVAEGRSGPGCGSSCRPAGLSTTTIRSALDLARFRGSYCAPRLIRDEHPPTCSRAIEIALWQPRRGEPVSREHLRCDEAHFASGRDGET